MFKNYFNFTISFCILFAMTVSAQTKLMTPETLWKLGRVGLDDISKDNNFIVYGITDYNLEKNNSNRNLFLQGVHSAAIKQLTTLDGGEWNARFSPGGSRVAFISKGTLWEVNMDGTEPHQVSALKMNGFEFSPDGTKILFTADVKVKQSESEIYKDLPYTSGVVYDDLMVRHFDHWVGNTVSNVFYADYLNGSLNEIPINIQNEAFDSPLTPDGGIDQISWSADSKSIAYTCKKIAGSAAAISTNSDIYLYNISTKATKNISEGNMGYDKNPVFSPDTKWLVWTSLERDGYESDKARLMLLDLSSNNAQRIDITKDFDRQIDAARWSPDSKRLYFTYEDQATIQIAYYDLSINKIVKITNGTQNYNAFFVANDNIIVEKQTITMPQEIVRLAFDGSETAFSDFNTSFWNTIKKAEVKKRMIKTKDGQQMLAWVIYPPDFDPAKKYPTLLYCQGGPQSAVNQFFSYRWNFQLMASKGYIIIAPNRRGLRSFGLKWNEEISGDYGGKAMDDLLSAIDDISKEAYVDKTKLGAVGASFGGYSIYWLAGHHNKRFKAFIAHSGMYNITSWYGSTEEVFFANWDQKGAYWDKPQPKSFKKFSPHLYVDKWDTPIMIIHGEKDFRVPITEGLQAFQAARLRGIPARFLTFPDENHWVVQPQNSILWQREFFKWLDTYLK